MQPCDNCHACSFPDKVAQAKATLPARWVAELVEEDAPDQIWVTAGNLYESFVTHDEAVPESFLQLLSGGEITDEDRAWAVKSLTDMGISASF
ncbi:hypothetical protein HMI48_09785 [Acidithiobacillus ferrooxidans]|uniref:hypothetical protein n=1 Tax=Acidithiobacillus ferrooxidans TaxID=920 RepID=UPI001C07323F|nr:hypothetical protein [Acidithiobacillus ferrooxidans]MBU2774170.1 hypothetical protein [Acidithiobacillus ferrooxidans]